MIPVVHCLDDCCRSFLMLMTLMHLRISAWYKPEQKVWRPYPRHIEKVMKADITCGILIKEAYKKL